MITEKEYKKLATKKDLEAFRSNVDQDIAILKMDVAKLKDDVKELKESQKEMQRSFTTGFDQVMGELKAIRQEQTAFSSMYNRHEDTLEDHERRLLTLETT